MGALEYQSEKHFVITLSKIVGNDKSLIDFKLVSIWFWKFIDNAPIYWLHLVGALPPPPPYATRWQSDRGWRKRKFLTCFSGTFSLQL